MMNIETKAETDAVLATPLTIVETLPVSVVTLRIKSPTDLRL